MDATPVMAQEIAQYQASCPNTPIALVGYSAGAIVVMNVLCAPTFPMTNIIAATAYGDETYSAGTPYDRGTCQVDVRPTYDSSCPPNADALQPGHSHSQRDNHMSTL